MTSRKHTEIREIGNAVTAALACGARAETSRLVRLLRATRISTPSSPEAVHRSDAALQLYGVRRERHQFFDNGLFGEPAPICGLLTIDNNRGSQANLRSLRVAGWSDRSIADPFKTEGSDHRCFRSRPFVTRVTAHAAV